MAEPAKKDKWADFEDAGQPIQADAKADPWAGFEDAGPSTGDKAQTFLRSAAGGVIEGVPAALGAIGGGILGFGAAGPVGAVGAGAAGLVLGSKFGQAINPFPQPKDVDPSLRPYAYAGEVMGGGAPIAAAPVAAGVAGLRMASTSGFGGFINRMLDMAASSPKSFLASEASRLGAAGVAAGVAESQLPGQALPRAGAEFAAGMLNPAALVIGAFGKTVDKAKGVLGSLGQSGAQRQAAQFLQTLLKENGEDPAKVAAFLRTSNIPGIKEMTSAQKSGSPALAALEAKLSQDSAKFGAERQKMGDEAMSAIKDMMVALRATGDPNALKAAAEIRQDYFKSIIAGRLQIAEREATEAAGKIATESPGARAAISRQADELLNGALRDVRTAERELWEAIPRDVQGGTANLTARYAELKNELLPNETLPTVIEGFVRQLSKNAEQGSILGADGKPLRSFLIGDDVGQTTSGNLLRFRSRALELARDAAANGNSGDARRYGILAEAALDDLGALPAATKGLDEARTFSRELHDTFTRTFAGDATAAGRGGRDRIPPELTLKFALGGGREQGALQLRQIEEAMKFLPARGLGGTAELGQMIDLQNRFLRVAASEAIDPMTGKVSQPRIADFLRKNEEILNKFPDVKSDLTKALSSAQELSNLQRTLTGATKVIEQQAAFSKFAGIENPANVVRNAVQGMNPVADLTGLAKVAKRGGTPAIEGLRASVWDDAIRRATDPSGTISADKLYNNMFKPVGPKQPSVMDVMIDNGIITSADKGKAEQLFKEFRKVETALGKGTNIEKIGEIDPLFDMVARMLGVHAASFIAPKGPGAIVAAGRASAYARNLFEKVPIAKMKDVLIQASTDKQFAAMLLEKPVTPAAKMKLATQIHAYMFQAGLTAIEGE